VYTAGLDTGGVESGGVDADGVDTDGVDTVGTVRIGADTDGVVTAGVVMDGVVTGQRQGRHCHMCRAESGDDRRGAGERLNCEHDERSCRARRQAPFLRHAGETLATAKAYPFLGSLTVSDPHSSNGRRAFRAGAAPV
jgi:hypothetical protein